MKVARLSALCIGRLYPHGDPWYSFLLEAESTQGHSEADRIKSMKHLKDFIGNRTLDLSALSTIPQPFYCVPPLYVRVYYDDDDDDSYYYDYDVNKLIIII